MFFLHDVTTCGDTMHRSQPFHGFGPTANRKVLGCLNEAAFVISYELENPRFSSIAELEDHFSDYIYSPTGYRRPRELAQELFVASSGAT